MCGKRHFDVISLGVAAGLTDRVAVAGKDMVHMLMLMMWMMACRLKDLNTKAVFV